jgi:AsmA protein
MPPNDASPRPPPRLGQVRPDRDGHVPPPKRPFSGPAYEQADMHRYALDGSRQRAPRRRTMVYAFLGFVGLLALGLGALVAAPPVDLVRAHVAAAVERQTGRKLLIEAAGVSFASGLGVSLGKVTLSAPPAMAGAPLFSAERIEVSLALFPLIYREVKVDRLTLIRPVIDLRVDDDGRRSWEFATGGEGRPPLRYAQVSGPRSDAGSTPPELADFMRNASPPQVASANDRRLGLEALSLADVRVEQGRIRYANRRSGFARELAGIDAILSLPSVGGPFSRTAPFRCESSSRETPSREATMESSRGAHNLSRMDGWR